jgi:Carboxypeptidase regulatory-like domain
VLRVRSGPVLVAEVVLPFLLAAARVMPAQEAGGVLRGTVTDTAGTAVPYALVRILGLGSEQFTGGRGGFGATGLPPGAYRVQVRQVGFQPFDSTVTVATGGTAVRVVLRPLAIRLDELSILAPGLCTDPGPPDPATSPELATIFTQLRENARRFMVLADSYPFLYFIERTFNDLTDNGEVVWSATDTVEYRSDSRGRYRAGDVLEPGVTARGRRERTVRLPSLPDLADSSFHANHCFAFGGVREQNGERLLRVSFRAAERLTGPDIDGEADLDPESYQLRYFTFQLTRPARALPSLRSLGGTMALLALHPNIVVPGSIRSVQVSSPTFVLLVDRPVTRHLEHQRLIRVHFLRPLPSDSTPQP